MPDVISKVCKGCEKDLPLTEFHKHKAGKYGRRSQCRGCRAAYNAANPEYMAEYGRKYRAEHREAKAARDKAYQQKHREKIAEYQRAYRQKHREKAAEYHREYCLANPEAMAEYGRRGQARRRARIRGSSVVEFSAEDLALRMSYFGNKCWMCSGPFEHIDHVKPISKGGSHMLSNLRPACRSCNSSKSAKWPFTLEDATWLCP